MDVTVALPAAGLEISADGAGWHALETYRTGGKTAAGVPVEAFATGGRVLLRTVPADAPPGD